MAEIYSRNVRREVFKRVPTADGRGITSVPDGIEIGAVQLKVDVDALMRWLGTKALKNKRGRATGMSGMVVAKVLSRKREAPKVADVTNETVDHMLPI